MDANISCSATQFLSDLPNADPYGQQWEFDASSGAGIDHTGGSCIDPNYPRGSQSATSSGPGINDHTGGSFIDPNYAQGSQRPTSSGSGINYHAGASFI